MSESYRVSRPWTSSGLYVQCNRYRTVVRAHDGWIDLGGFDLIFQGAGDQEIVYAPADVSFAGFGEVRPPGVVSFSLLEHAEGIDEAGVDEGLEASALLVSEALFADIGFVVGQIVRRVSNVKVAAEDH